MGIGSFLGELVRVFAVVNLEYYVGFVVVLLNNKGNLEKFLPL